MKNEDYEDLIISIFDYFSNKFPLYGQLVFTDRTELINGNFAATAPFGTMFVFRQVLFNFLKEIDSDDEIKTLLVYIIGHECSHVNQFVDFYKLQYSTDPMFKKFYYSWIEDANDENIIKVIYDNLDKIKIIFNFNPVMCILDNVLIGTCKSAFKPIYKSNHDCLNEYYSMNMRALFHDDSYKKFPNIMTTDGEVIKKDGSYLEMKDFTKISLDVKYVYMEKFNIISSDGNTLVVE